MISSIIIKLLFVSACFIAFYNAGIHSMSSYIVKNIIDNTSKSIDNEKLSRIVKMQKLSFSEMLYLHFIDRSNIRSIIPFFSLNLLFFLSLMISIIVYFKVYGLLRFAPSAFIISIISGASIFLILDLMARYNMNKIRRSLSDFICILNRWCTIKEDILYAFEKSLDSGLSEPLKSFVSDTVIQIKTGIEPCSALEMLGIRVNSHMFDDFITNIRQVIKNRGDIKRLLSIMEEQFYKMEEEYNRRKISTYKDRVVIYLVMTLVIPLAYSFIRINTEVTSFYLYTVSGKVLLMGFCILYVIGFFITAKVGKYMY